VKSSFYFIIDIHETLHPKHI